VLDIARHSGARVIEDAAQALGATWHDQSVGLAGDIGFFSLAVGKGLTTFGGGVLIARDPAMRALLRATSARIIPHSLYWEARRLAELAGYAALYNPAGLRYAYGNPLRRNIEQGRLVEAVGDDFDFGLPLHRVSRYRKAIGARALARLPAFLHETESQARQRIDRLGLPVLQDAPGGHGPWPFLMVMMPSPQARDAALDQLWGAGLGVSRLFIHALPDYGYLRHLFPQADVPNARDFAARMLTVSNSLWLDEEGFESARRILASAARGK
jgi:dTDP-4-amino-4,6-dideoxygalactose transaminase